MELARFIATAIALVVVAFFYHPDNLNSFWTARKFPLVGKELGNRKQRVKAFLSPAGFRLFLRGYEQFKNGVFRVSTDEGELIVVPNSALDDLRNLGDDHITRYEAMDLKTQGAHTGLYAADDGLTSMIRNEINRRLPLITDMMHAEAGPLVASALGDLPSWTPAVPAQAILRVVTTVIGRVLVGEELCHADVYNENITQFARNLFVCSRKLVQLPPLLRYVARYTMPEFWQLRTSRKRVAEFLRPVIAERRRLLREAAAAQGGEAVQVPEDNLTWTLRRLDGGGDGDKKKKHVLSQNSTVEAIAHEQFGLSVSANSITMLTANAVLYELAACESEVVAALRREIRTARATHGSLNSRALFDLKLLDSTMREAMRLSPTNATRWMRRANKPVVLPSCEGGPIVIPAGATFRVLASPPLLDPALYPNPERFEPFRFARLREGAEPDPIGFANREMYQFVSASKENLQWGLDRHACPGRFFAAIVIKLVLAEIIERYDVRMPGGGKEKYPYVERGEFRGFDHTKPLEFRNVAV